MVGNLQFWSFESKVSILRTVIIGIAVIRIAIEIGITRRLIDSTLNVISIKADIVCRECAICRAMNIADLIVLVLSLIRGVCQIEGMTARIRRINRRT